MDIILFTIQPDKRRRYVATIKAAEVLNEEQIWAALKVFKERGWYWTMMEEVTDVGGDATVLGNAPEAKDVLNGRFRVANVPFNKPNYFADANDPVSRLSRYTLCDLANVGSNGGGAAARKRKGATAPPTPKKIFRRATAGTEFNPEHAAMQAKLMAALKKEFPGALIVAEEDYIDVSVRTADELILFEIKSDIEPRVVIRQALGQILEYAFYSHRARSLPLRLVVVGRSPLSPVDRLYLRLLREKFSLPLEYRVVSV